MSDARRVPMRISLSFQDFLRGLVGFFAGGTRTVSADRRREGIPIDLCEARDDFLKDIGLLDRPDVCLRRSDLPPTRRKS